MQSSAAAERWFEGVKEFNLSWEEIVKLGRNSLYYSFLDAPTKQRLLAGYDKRITAFAEGFQRRGWSALGDAQPVTYGFLCRHYQICLAP
jgi:adenosine deaminase CECR1